MNSPHSPTLSDTRPATKANNIGLEHRRATRWMHWVNFPVLTIMIWSGLRIYWADLRDPQVISVAGIELFKFFPDWFNETFGLKAKLAQGLGYHLVFSWFFTLNGIAYAIHTVRSGHWRDLNPGRHGLKGALREIKSSFSPKYKHDTSLGYNPAQRVIYNFIVALGGVSVLSGFAIYRPNTLGVLTTLLGGYQTAKTIHFVVTIVFIAFFFVHVAQVLRCGPAGLAAMITGPGVGRSKTVMPKVLASKVELSETDTEAATLTQSLIRVGETRTDSDKAPIGLSESDVGKPVTAASRSVKPTDTNMGRRAALTAGITVGATALGWRWLQTQPRSQRLPATLRSGHELVEGAWRPFDERSKSVRTFSPSEAGDIRVNGRHGIREPIDLTTWNLAVRNGDGVQIDTLTMDDITALPEVSMTTEHICIEGWSQIVTWTGARFSDFADLFSDQVGDYTFVNLATPDDGYYVSLDVETMRHSSTLLAYALNNKTLTQDHGAPLRLATPKKYGIKQIKRIGSIELARAKGPDYWTERGYDWYAHL